MTWSAVDDADDPHRFVSGLDEVNADPFFRSLKARVDELLGDAAPLVDVGCGVGDDVAGRGVGVDVSWTMVSAARSRHPSLPLAQGSGPALPVRSASVAAVRADRVLQHLADAGAALAEWRRVLGPGRRLVTCDPDHTTASVHGVPTALAADVCRFRASTRPGAALVAGLETALRAAGFEDVEVERVPLEVGDLARMEGIMGLAEWGEPALGPALGREWRAAVLEAAAAERLLYRCDYLIGRAVR